MFWSCARSVRQPAVMPVARAPVGDACRTAQASPAIPEPYPESAAGAVLAARGLHAARVRRAIELATRRREAVANMYCVPCASLLAGVHRQ
jgi:hypothetical protein